MKNKIELFKRYLINTLFFFLPWWLLVQNIVLISLTLLPPYKIKKEQFKLIKKGFLLFIVYTFLNSLFNNTIGVEKENLLKILPLVFIPFVFNKLKTKVIYDGLLFLFIGIILMQLYSIYGVIDYQYFYEGKKYELTNYTKLNSILGFERPYLGYFSALNIILSYFFFKRTKKWIFSIGGILSLGTIFYVSARLALILSIIFLITILLNEIKSKKKIVTLILGSLVIVVIFLFAFNSSIKKRFSLIQKDSRTVIWSGTLKELNTSKDFIFGNGSLVKTRNNLYSFYRTYDKFENIDVKNRFIKKNYNTHNQFLSELIRGGVLGLFLFIFPIIIAIKENIKKKNIINISILVSIVLFLLVENLLERQIGVYLLALVLTITTFKDKLLEE